MSPDAAAYTLGSSVLLPELGSCCRELTASGPANLPPSCQHFYYDGYFELEPIKQRFLQTLDWACSHHTWLCHGGTLDHQQPGVWFLLKYCQKRAGRTVLLRQSVWRGLGGEVAHPCSARSIP